MGEYTGKRSDVRVDIFNKAADRIGQTEAIEDENEVRLLANLCRRHFDDCLEEALELKPFPWSGKQCRPTPLEARRVGWAYTYQLPPDFIACRALISGGQRFSLLRGEERIPYELQATDDSEGKLLCTDYLFESEDALEYTTRVTNVGDWPRLFVSAVAFRLAFELALAIPKDTNLAKGMWDSFEVMLARAFAQSLNQQTPDQPATPDGVAARG